MSNLKGGPFGSPRIMILLYGFLLRNVVNGLQFSLGYRRCTDSSSNGVWGFVARKIINDILYSLYVVYKVAQWIPVDKLWEI